MDETATSLSSLTPTAKAEGEEGKSTLEIDIELVPVFPLLKPMVNRPRTTHAFSMRANVCVNARARVCLQLKMWNWIAKTVIKAEAVFCN